METDFLQISQHEASLKHENFTLSYHSYTTLLPQNILQLQLHFSCTLYSINNLSLRKLGLVGMVSYHYIRDVQPFAIAGRSTFIYEVQPPMSSSYIYEIRLRIGNCQVRTNT